MKRYLLLVGPLVMLWGTEARATPSFITSDINNNGGRVTVFEESFTTSGTPFESFYYSSGQEDRLNIEVVGEKFNFQGADYGSGKGDEKGDGHAGKVPEPVSLLLLGAGLAGIGIWRRKSTR